MQRSLVNFQPLGPLSWAKGASSRLVYGAWSCLLTNPGQRIWLGKATVALMGALPVMCVAYTDVDAVLVFGLQARMLKLHQH